MLCQIYCNSNSGGFKCSIGFLILEISGDQRLQTQPDRISLFLKKLFFPNKINTKISRYCHLPFFLTFGIQSLFLIDGEFWIVGAVGWWETVQYSPSLRNCIVSKQGGGGHPWVLGHGKGCTGENKHQTFLSWIAGFKHTGESHQN